MSIHLKASSSESSQNFDFDQIQVNCGLIKMRPICTDNTETRQIETLRKVGSKRDTCANSAQTVSVLPVPLWELDRVTVMQQ